MNAVTSRTCPDCPATPTGVLNQLVLAPQGCAMRCVSIAARAPFPDHWKATYGMALVRRGIVVRQRMDAQGHATALDVAGPGAAMPLGATRDDEETGYAVSDAMVCLIPNEAMQDALGNASSAFDVVRLQTTVIDRIERIADARSRKSPVSRVARLLRALADTLSPPRRLTVIPASLQQRDLGALLALRHESVCRALAKLVSKGAVRHSPGGVRIVDLAALETF